MAAVAVATLASCDFEAVRAEDGALKPPEVSTCDSSSECMTGLVCDQGVHLCVAGTPTTLTGWLRLLPPSDSVVAVEEQYPGMTMDSKNPLTLSLSRPISVTGRVFVKGDALNSEVADIVAETPGEIPDLKIQAYTLATPAGFDEMGMAKAGFDLMVTPDKVYDIRVYLASPDGTGSLPPFHVQKKFSTNGKGTDPYKVDWDIEVPAVEDYYHITGRLVKYGTDAAPIASASVVAQSPETGDESSIAGSGPDGSFDILVQPPEVPQSGVTYEVRVGPGPGNEMVPSAVIGEVFVGGDPASPSDLGNIQIEGLTELETVSIEVVGGDGTFDPVFLSGTEVTFTGTVGMERKGILHLKRTVDASGVVTIDLPTAFYVVSVIPPDDSSFGDEQKWGILQKQVQLYSRDDPFEVVAKLSPMPEIKGRVLAPDATPLAGVQIRAVHSSEPKYSEVPLPTREFVALSDETGHYAMRVDAGQYVMVLDAPVTTGLPRIVQRETSVSKTQTRDWKFPQPSAISGVIVGYSVPETAPAYASEGLPSGKGPDANAADLEVVTPEHGPIAQVRVELYDQVDANDGTDGTMPVPVATATTDETGTFVLMVPAD